ncbi:aspartate/glutamate racemase family protein [Enterococcus sp. LJL99]
MKTIGLLGGMSWESTMSYYSRLNELVNDQLGGLHSAKINLVSVDFDEIERCQKNNQWEKAGAILGKEAKSLEVSGADFMLICTNTMHKVVAQIAEHITMPILHIADATIEELKKNKIEKVGLLGTEYTMKQDFYKERIIASGITVSIPTDEEMSQVNTIIFEELCQGEILAESKQTFLQIIEHLVADGAQGIILGCTEIGLLIQQKDVTTPIFDTTEIHCQAAVQYVLA